MIVNLLLLYNRKAENFKLIYKLSIISNKNYKKKCIYTEGYADLYNINKYGQKTHILDIWKKDLYIETATSIPYLYESKFMNGISKLKIIVFYGDQDIKKQNIATRFGFITNYLIGNIKYNTIKNINKQMLYDNMININEFYISIRFNNDIITNISIIQEDFPICTIYINYITYQNLLRHGPAYFNRLRMAKFNNSYYLYKNNKIRKYIDNDPCIYKIKNNVYNGNFYTYNNNGDKILLGKHHNGLLITLGSAYRFYYKDGDTYFILYEISKYGVNWRYSTTIFTREGIHEYDYTNINIIDFTQISYIIYDNLYNDPCIDIAKFIIKISIPINRLFKPFDDVRCCNINLEHTHE